jgi:hypothetical protein
MTRPFLSILLSLLLLIGLFSCEKKAGCTDVAADNYDESANTDNGNCTYNAYFLCIAWKLSKYEVNGLDSTASLLALKPNLNLFFFREQTYKEIYYPGAGSQVTKNGIWFFQQGYTALNLVEKPSEITQTFLINTLNDTALVLTIQTDVERRYTYSPKL